MNTQLQLLILGYLGYFVQESTHWDSKTGFWQLGFTRLLKIGDNCHLQPDDPLPNVLGPMTGLLGFRVPRLLKIADNWAQRRANLIFVTFLHANVFWGVWSFTQKCAQQKCFLRQVGLDWMDHRVVWGINFILFYTMLYYDIPFTANTNWRPTQNQCT